MSKGIFYILIFSIFCISFGQDCEEKKAISLANEFIEKLRSNTPFSYAEEDKFFGEKTLYGFVLLLQLGYISKDGQWLKEKPKYSLLGELIRMNSKFLLVKNPNKQYLFYGKPLTVIDGKFIPWEFFANITYIQEVPKKTFPTEENLQAIILTYRIPQGKLDFPIFINGKSFLNILGFQKPKNGIPELKKEEEKCLLEHIQNLNRKINRKSVP